MHRSIRLQLTCAAAIVSLAILSTGCTSLHEYVHNGFKVGPNYQTISGSVANNWIDAADVRIRGGNSDISQWWTVFNDPVLNDLIACAYRQNLSVKQAAFRVLQSRYNLAIAKGEFFPQVQTASGGYSRAGSTLLGFDNNWNFGFNLGWEMDFWGRLRRAIQASDDQLGASIANYDDVMVTLLSDIAQTYVSIRTSQEQIKLLNENLKVQRDIYTLTNTRLGIGTLAELDVQQAKSTLMQTEAAIPSVIINMRQANDQLCTLLGIPPADLLPLLGEGPIPSAPPEIVIGIPCEMLRRRPDVRRAERNAAAQAEQIGIAEAQLYPIFSINGSMNWSADRFQDMFNTNAFSGSTGPSFNWRILNYGRIINNVRIQDAAFQELVLVYQQTVLVANQQVEDGLITFLQNQERTKMLYDSMKAGEIARGITLRLYEAGRAGFDFNRYALIEQNLITQQTSWAQAKGQIAQGLISVYRALGGGWEIRLNPPPAPQIVMPVTPPPEAQEPGMPPAGAGLMPEVLPPQANPIPEPPQANPVLEPPNAPQPQP
jgi:NodT family efflux transporter outer membrane factor (OMF) lipoprotein